MERVGRLEWIQRPNMPHPTQWASSCVMDGIVHVFGGLQKGQRFSSRIQAFNPTTNEWNVLQSELAIGRQEHTSNEVGGISFIIGGWDESSKHLSSVESFNPRSSSK